MAPISVVICTGSFHVSDHYLPFAETLHSKGIEAVCPLLPTNDVCNLSVEDPTNPAFDASPPPGGWANGYDDAKVVRNEVEKLLERGKDVLLVAHSYGGWVATEAAAPELQKKSRETQGHSTGVVGIFYAVANVLPKGHSLASFFVPKDQEPGPMPPYVSFHKPGMDGLVTPVRGEEFFYNDLPLAEGKHWASLMRASPVQQSVLSHASYLDMPCAFLTCQNDKIMPPFVQQMMIDVSKDQGGSMRTYNCSSGHSAVLSWKDGFACAVQDFASGL